MAANQDLSLQASQTDITLNKPGRVDIVKALTLRVQNNLPYREIATILGCHHSSVHAALRRFEVLIMSPDQVTAYEDNRGKLLSGAEVMLLTDMTDKEKRKKATINNLAYAWDKVQAAKRLHDNKTTENIVLLQAVITEHRDILDTSAEAMMSRMRDASDDDDEE